MSMKKEKEEPKQYEEVGLGEEFLGMAAEHRANKDVMVALEKRNKELGKLMEPELVARGVSSVLVEELVVVRSNGRSPSNISSHRLLEKGVTLEVLNYATIPGIPYTYVQVRRKGQKDDDHE